MRSSPIELRMRQRSPLKYFIIVSWCSACFVVGLLIFARGLLLHRNVLPNKSSCASPDESCSHIKSLNALEKCLLSHSSRPKNEQICTTSKFKIVLIIIDALRYDFIEYNKHQTNESFYTNKLVVVRDLLRNQPNKTRLFKFIADPPTTTMQRILGLTTGSLPTFIDVGSNFASSEINEDNIVDLLNRQGKNAVFLGDDTWFKLYPNRFIRCYPFDSFNVWDLDTVDYGIRKHLFTELRKKDWHLLIAHFLGVDHCGHRYGPDHSEMKRKLKEMNDILESIVKQIEYMDDILLFVIGDHGMTSAGDHGGDTENEITTALFTYSPVYDLYGGSSGTQVMRQVDMAPTLSSILGLPIPFSSVGSVILECFPVILVGTLSETVFQLWRNVEQITNYVFEYSSHNAQLKATNKVDATLLRYQTLKNARTSIVSDMHTFLRQHRTYMADILAMCREVWVQFDALFIGCGLCLMLVATLLCCYICETLAPGEVRTFAREYVFVFAGKIICLLLFAAFCAISLFRTNVESAPLVGTAVACAVVMAWWSRRFFLKMPAASSIRQRITAFDAFVTLVVLVSLGGLFSNSFIVEEPSVILFLMCSVMWIRFLFHRPAERVWKRTTLLLYTATVHIALRVALEFLKCHEEQARCKDIVLKKYESRLCVASVVALALFVGNWLRNHPPKGCVFVAVACTTLQIMYWVCETFALEPLYVLDIPALLLPLIVFSICCLIISPLPRSRQNYMWPSFDVAISNVALFLGLLGCVVLGQTYAVPVILMMVSFRALAVFLSSCSRSASNKNENKYQVPWSNVILWAMSSIYWFYVTGHYASFAGIQWNAAFLLQKEIGSNTLMPGFLVMLNTFFSYMVHAIALPILFASRWAASSKPVLSIRSTNGVTSNNNINNQLQDLDYFYHGIFTLTMKYLTFFGIRLFFVSLSATILSRHLMMWKIFAPKFIFEGIAFMVVTVPSVLLGFVYVHRIGHKIHGDSVVESKRST